MTVIYIFCDFIDTNIVENWKKLTSINDYNVLYKVQQFILLIKCDLRVIEIAIIQL